MSDSVVIDYTSWRGLRRSREIKPLRIWFGSTEWHKEQQWLLRAVDLSDGLVKDFAVEGIHSWQQRRHEAPGI